MRWYISYPVLAAGLAFGFHTFFPEAPDLASQTRIQTGSVAEPERAPIVLAQSEIEALPESRLAAFSPGARLLAAEIPRSSSSVLDYLAQTLTPREAAPEVRTEAVHITTAGWKSAIARTAQPAATAPAARPAEPLSRAALARDIQRELQRVGCYLGEIDGVWGGGSKRAILVFMDRVNATLPTREPDVFMLSLLRAQTTPVCGASCPRGQSFAAGGRCVPTTLAAQADEGRAPAGPSAEAWRPEVAEATGRPPMPYGRMSIGGPKPDDVAEISSGWSPAARAPNRAVPLERTAALDVLPVAEGDDGQPAEAARSSFDTDAVPVQRSKRSANRAKVRAAAPRRSSSSRQVQHLFQHPLGRM